MSRALAVLLAGACGALGTLLAAACSSYGSSDDHASPDGAGGTSTDASDAPTNDGAGSSLDASDAGPDCANPFSLREPFADEASLGAWLVTQTNGTIGVSSTLPSSVVPPSPPSALYATGTVPDGGAGVSVSAERDFPLVSMRGRLTFAVYVPQTTNYAEVGCVLRFVGPSAVDAVTIQVYTNSISLACRKAAPIDGTIFDLGPSPGTSFTTVETTFAVDADAAVAHATVRRLGSNGVVLATGDIGAITLPSDANTMKLVCGIGYADASNNPSSRNLQVAVDDIALDFCRP